jgi:hypothetical protein
VKPREQETATVPLLIAPLNRSFIANGCRTDALNAVAEN